MSYRVYNLRSGDSYGRKSSDMREFEDAMDMAKEGMDRICELAEEMVELYGERRGGYGNRGNYGMRDEWDDMDGMYGMRRRRDRMGRYM